VDAHNLPSTCYNRKAFWKGRLESTFVFLRDRNDDTVGIQAIICHLVSLLLSEANSEPKEFTFQQALGKIRGFRVHPLTDSERNAPGEHTTA